MVLYYSGKKVGKTQESLAKRYFQIEMIETWTSFGFFNGKKAESKVLNEIKIINDNLF